ncbi:MAG: hypothetical protein M5R42_04635 [Rhodocyclaceae bacterium]|nr:hypothetical protein [Rhodocyclaceae bacterium]
MVASILITFVPCSARSAIVLALGGKYLGVAGVFAVFALAMLTVAVLGRLLGRRYQKAGPGLVQEIPPYRLPAWPSMLRSTWARTRDILTIVTPLLIAGSVVLALLAHFGADAVINAALTPVTVWWLGLPVALGVPILFGILRKELSLLMVYQALGTLEIAPLLDWVQILVFLVFLTFYIPCVSTFAVMLKTLGRREAFFSVALSVGVALGLAGVTRLGAELLRPGRLAGAGVGLELLALRAADASAPSGQDFERDMAVEFGRRHPVPDLLSHALGQDPAVAFDAGSSRKCRPEP